MTLFFLLLGLKIKDKIRAGLKLNEGLEKVLEIQKKPTI